jgi:hypothetical protein
LAHAGCWLAFGLFVVVSDADAASAAVPALDTTGAAITAPARVDRAFAIAAAMAGRLRQMAQAAAEAQSAVSDDRAAPPMPSAPAPTQVVAIAATPVIRAGRSALGKPALRQVHERAAGQTGYALCSHFRTYDATSGTYRGFDGVTHACRPGGQARRKATSSRDAAAAAPPAPPVNAAIVEKTKVEASGSAASYW